MKLQKTPLILIPLTIEKFGTSGFKLSRIDTKS